MPQTLILDSSQLSTVYECLEKWYRLNVEGITISNKTTDKMMAGTLFHKWLEIYYYGVGYGMSKVDAANLARSFDYDAADEIDSYHFPAESDLRKKLTEKRDQYFLTYSLSDYEVGTAESYDVRIVDGFPIDTTKKVPLVEQGFSYKLLDTREYLFVLEGKIDWIGFCDKTKIWMDHKSQLTKSDLFPKSLQFRNYALVTGLNLGVINYIRLADKLDKDTFVRQPINFSPHERMYWKQELTEKYVEVAKLLKSERLNFPSARSRNRDACKDKWHRVCQFANLCNEFNPSTWQAVKERDFVRKVEWKPW